MLHVHNMKINNNITGIVGIILFTLGLLKIINIYLLQKVITIISEFLIDLHFGSFSSKGYIKQNAEELLAYGYSFAFCFNVLLFSNLCFSKNTK